MRAVTIDDNKKIVFLCCQSDMDRYFVLQWKYPTVPQEAKMMTTNDHGRGSAKVKELGWAVAVESMI